MPEAKHARLRYISFFLLSLLSAFFTYQTFNSFMGSTTFSTPVMVLNTIVFLFLWIISFTGHTRFVCENVTLVFVIPAIGIYFTDLFVALSTPSASMMGFFEYALASSTLLFSSYHSRKYEEILKSSRSRFS
ncbi:MAG: hypothetical protein ABEJ99_03920 [Candidatus Nanohaloarchaea archaeon]